MTYKYLNKDNVHIYLWGVFFNYPECCIEDVILHWHLTGSDREQYYKDYINKHIADDTGFIPCPKCQKETNNMNEAEFVGWLGRDLFSHKSTYADDIKTELYQSIYEKLTNVLKRRIK